MTNRNRWILTLLLLSPIVSFSQPASGTLNIVKRVDPVLDTIKIFYGEERYFKSKAVKYRYAGGARMKISNFVFRSNVPSAYYLISYPENRALHSQGEIKDAKMHGTWKFYRIFGDPYTICKFNNGELVSKPKTIAGR